MRVESSCNTFSDLTFFNVGTVNDGDCLPLNNNDKAAVILKGDNNSFTNVNHTRSIGAVSFDFIESCNGNQILNLSVEQEDSPCEDPSLLVRFPGQCSGNYIVTNYNGATNVLPGAGRPSFENSNIVLPDIIPDLNTNTNTNLTSCSVPPCTIE
jgi:hypothetical protein